ncbi:YbhB/YbcL family Raf kinase inhibitor-like protein [Haloarcula laminariae]|uniref:YbhB/YbcL family Raf kinase inhibitor-like protein n=1 Tax=Haloarcula laminariae TaxID=2961577 RepID=UPI0021C6AC19|nr:YbhB/YbcL family Raf kinase inhibitor-like protein [Halomicroarcula laminariae]
MNRRRVLQAAGGSLSTLFAGCTSRSEGGKPSLVVTSSALQSGGSLPTRFTCDGAGDSPPFRIEQTPGPTASLAIVSEYDRGPLNEPVFWSIWNVPPETTDIPSGIPRTPTVANLGGARQGRQRGGEVGYKPPCTPPGQSYEHRFQVYALGEMLDLEAGTKHDDSVEAIGSAALASRRFTVTLQRSATTAERVTDQEDSRTG